MAMMGGTSVHALVPPIAYSTVDAVVYVGAAFGKLR